MRTRPRFQQPAFAGFLNSRILFTPTEDGVYKLAVTSADAGGLGLYRLTIRKAVEDKK